MTIEATKEEEIFMSHRHTVSSQDTIESEQEDREYLLERIEYDKKREGEFILCDATVLRKISTLSLFDHFNDDNFC